MTENSTVESTFDPDAEPVEAPAQINEMLWELRRIAAQEKHLAELKKGITADLLPRLYSNGRPVMVTDPMTGELLIARPVQSKPIKVDAGELLKVLIDYYNDEEQADLVWAECLKPAEVDSKQEGRFEAAMQKYEIPVTVIGPILREKPSSPYVGFGRR